MSIFILINLKIYNISYEKRYSKLTVMNIFID